MLALKASCLHGAKPAAGGTAVVVDQSQTLTRAKPDFVKLTKGLLAHKDLGPKLAELNPK